MREVLHFCCEILVSVHVSNSSKVKRVYQMTIDTNIVHKFSASATFIAIFLAFTGLTTAATQFDGRWQFNITTTHGPCIAAPGEVTVEDGKIKGTVKGVNETPKVSGKIKPDGSIRGRVSKGLANFRGKITGNSTVISWSGRGGCKGKIRLRKL